MSRPPISASHLDAAEPRRRRAVARAHHLLRLSFAAVWRTPECPLVARADGIEGVPELRRDSRVRRVLHHAQPLPAFDLPANFAAELKVIALVVDRPRAVGLHQKSMIRGSNQLLQAERLLTRQQADVGHANHREPIPALRAQRAARAALADGVRGLARTEITGKQSVRDNRRALRRNSLIVEAKSAESRPMLLARVGNHIHHLAAVAKRTKLVEREKRRAGEVRLHAQHAIKLDGMPDRFVNLQPQLRTLKNNVEHTLGTLLRAMQSHGLFGNPPRVLDQLQLFNQFISL